jgi:hypothetical protein
LGETFVIHSGLFAGHNAIFAERLPDLERLRVVPKLLKNRQTQVNLPGGLILPKKKPRLTVRKDRKREAE